MIKSKRISWMSRDGLAEIASRLRWFWTYSLPKILAGPFNSLIFRTGYFIFLIVFFLLTLSSYPVFWRGFLLNILKDLGVNYIGPNSISQGLQWLVTLPVRVIFLILLTWGISVPLWAKPRTRFLACLEESMHLRVCRGGGIRALFLSRLNRMLSRGLARGPSGEILPLYSPIPEYRSFLDEARKIRSTGFPRGLLISAPSAAGKTRTALELIADLNPPMIVEWPRQPAFTAYPAVPRWNGFFILLADNLAFESSKEQAGIPTHLHILLQSCPQALLIVTLRQEFLREDIRDLKVFRMAENDDIGRYVGLAEAVVQAETRAGFTVSPHQVLARYNGFPGSLVAGLEVMRDEYALLTDEERGFLQVIRLLRELGVQKLTSERVWNGYQNVFGVLPPFQQQEAVLRKLLKKNFCSQVE